MSESSRESSPRTNGFPSKPGPTSLVQRLCALSGSRSSVLFVPVAGLLVFSWMWLYGSSYSSTNSEFSAQSGGLSASLSSLLPHGGQSPPPKARPIHWPGTNDESDPGFREVDIPAGLEDIYNATLGFEKIFIISLPLRSDRRDGMSLGASLTNISFEFFDGVVGATVPDKALSLSGPRIDRSEGEIGCWRGHMNAMRHITDNNIASALILEDDVDWDVRLRDQLAQVALATRALSQPLLHKQGAHEFSDPTFPRAAPGDPLKVPDLEGLDALPPTVPPTGSPYGDNWDVLWLGHCGMKFPLDSATGRPDEIDGRSGNNPDALPVPTPKGRVAWKDDTVPAQHHLKNYHYYQNDARQHNKQYAAHTRVVHHSEEGVCTFGYAVTQRTARAMLWEIGLWQMFGGVDIELREFCEGRQAHALHRCLTVQPPLFNTHRPVWNTAGDSDNNKPVEGFRNKAYTENVRWSVRLNVDELLNGGTNLTDQLPD